MTTARTLDVPGWVDLSTTDPDAAADFYATLLGWDTETSETPMGSYHIGTVGGTHVGGMMATPPGEEVPPMWTMFVTVRDVAATLERVRSAGGAVLEGPIPIPNGQVGVVADPTGAMFGVISYEEPPPEVPWRSGRPGAVCWVDLLSRDPDAAVPFYTTVFGWEPRQEGDFTALALGGDDVAGMLPMPAGVPVDVPSHWSVYFAVEDCAATEARAVELGGSVLQPTMAFGMGKIAVLADPQGAAFDLMEVEA